MKAMYSLRSFIFFTQAERMARDQLSSIDWLSSRKAAQRRSTLVQISFFWRQSKLLHCSADLDGPFSPWLTNSPILMKQPLGFQYYQLIFEQGQSVAQQKGKSQNLLLWCSRNRPSGLNVLFFLSLLSLAIILTGFRLGVTSSCLTPYRYKTGIVECSSHSSKMESLSSQALVYASFLTDLACFFTIFRKLFKTIIQLSNIHSYLNSDCEQKILLKSPSINSILT